MDTVRFASDVSPRQRHARGNPGADEAHAGKTPADPKVIVAMTELSPSR
jgi:hypothetical protein